MSATLTIVLDQITADPAAWAERACREAEARIPAARDARDWELLVEILTGAQDTYNRAFREGHPQAVRLRAARTIRRAERAIGQALRAGQEAGEIRVKGQSQTDLPGAADVLRLKTRTHTTPYYDMAAGSDAEFEQALADAEAEGNLARSVVSRFLDYDGDYYDPDWIPDPSDRTTEAAIRRRELVKELAAKGNSSRQISSLIGTTDKRIREIAADMGVEIAADMVVRKTRRDNDSNRIAEEVASTLTGLATAVTLVDFDQIDAAQAQNWAASMCDSLRTLTRFAKQIKETQ